MYVPNQGKTVVPWGTGDSGRKSVSPQGQGEMAQPSLTPPEELGEASIGTNPPNTPKTKDKPAFMYVFVSEKRMGAIGQRGAPEPRTQPERARQHLLRDPAISLSHSAGEGSGHSGTDAAQPFPPAT